MTSLFLTMLFLVSLFLMILNRLKFAFITVLINFIFFLIIGSGLVAYFLLHHLESNFSPLIYPKWGINNTFVLLGGGNVLLPSGLIKPNFLVYSRIHETTRLYSMCKKTNSVCKIIISGGDPLLTGKSEAAVYQEELLTAGVNNSDIILEQNSMNTYKNAEFTNSILSSNKFDHVFLITSGIHMKRAMLYFAHFGIHPIPAISDYIKPRISLAPLGYNFAITDFALYEEIGIIRFYVYNLLGLNTKN